MEGDPLVDRLMKPVIATIEHYVKNQAGVFAIYNRAYEAVMNSMVVLDTMRDQLSKANAHAEEAEARVAELEARVAELQLELANETHHVYNWDGFRFAKGDKK